MDKDFLNQFGWIVNSFDFDRDGELDNGETMFAMNAFGVMAEARSSEEEKSLYELAAAGVDVSTFDFMDEDERREAIEDAGLDPDDYDFD
jgi:hypothetical protein